LWRRPDDRMWQDVEITTLVMERLTDAELENYLATGDWQGKAGAFGYQDGLDWVRVVSGSESNVVGLPLELLERMIANVDREQVS